jgi:cell wall-associated NlpC family hydrolase
MPDNGRSPSKLLIYALALPVLALVYVTSFGSRLWAALRPSVATFLGATVIASVYGETAYRKAPGPVRAGAVMALAFSLVATSFSAPAGVAAADPAEAVIDAARQYLGADFRLGTEGPRSFDCSGLVYRAFADAGELPRIGGMRLRARGYMQYFVSRGRFTKEESEARRGDLVIYDRGEHIGFYLGDGKVLSALVDPWGVSIHRLHGIKLPVTYFLRVNWGGGDSGDNGGGDNGGGDNGGGDNGGGDNGGGDDNVGSPGDNNGQNTSAKPDAESLPEQPDGGEEPDAGQGNSPNNGGGEGVTAGGKNAMALGTMNLRTAADPNARIIGWIGRGGTFKIVDRGLSPAGYPWFKVETRSGKAGWVYARWVREL